MYEYFRGEVTEKTPTSLVLDVNGVGYRFFIPLSTSEKLPAKGKVKILAFPYIREDEMRLYGFLDAKERELFTLLLTVKGVGPQVALGILSSMTISEFQKAVISEDAGLINTIRGIGKKLAQRIIVELAEPLMRVGIYPEGVPPLRLDNLADDGSKALVSLGYPKKVADDAVRNVQNKFPEISTVEDLVRKALAFTR